MHNKFPAPVMDLVYRIMMNTLRQSTAYNKIFTWMLLATLWCRKQMWSSGQNLYEMESRPVVFSDNSSFCLHAVIAICVFILVLLSDIYHRIHDQYAYSNPGIMVKLQINDCSLWRVAWTALCRFTTRSTANAASWSDILFQKDNYSHMMPVLFSMLWKVFINIPSWHGSHTWPHWICMYPHWCNDNRISPITILVSFNTCEIRNHRMASVIPYSCKNLFLCRSTKRSLSLWGWNTSHFGQYICLFNALKIYYSCV